VKVLHLVLLIVAAVCFAIAASSLGTRANFVALGLLSWVLVPLSSAIESA